MSGRAMLRSITDVLMRCPLCGKIQRVGDSEPDVDGDGSSGCNVADCGGVLIEMGKVIDRELTVEFDVEC